MGIVYCDSAFCSHSTKLNLEKRNSTEKSLDEKETPQTHPFSSGDCSLLRRVSVIGVDKLADTQSTFGRLGVCLTNFY